MRRIERHVKGARSYPQSKLTAASSRIREVRKQLEQQKELVREDVTELLEDYDALADVHMRVVKNLETPQ